MKKYYLSLLVSVLVAVTIGCTSSQMPPSGYFPYTGIVLPVLAPSGEICIVEFDQQAYSTLVSSGFRFSFSQLSPGGQFSVFQYGYKDRPGFFEEYDDEIFVMDLQTGDIRQLTDNQDLDYGAEWSLDGESILFTSHWRGQGLYRIAANGNNRELLMEGDASPFTQSPDGEWIGYVRERSLVRLSLSARTVETLIEQNVDYYSSSVSWSPDGNLIAFLYETDGTTTGSQVAVYDFRDREVHVLIPREEVVHRLQWTPDGEWLTVMANYQDVDLNGRFYFYKIRPDGSEFQRVVFCTDTAEVS